MEKTTSSKKATSFKEKAELCSPDGRCSSGIGIFAFMSQIISMAQFALASAAYSSVVVARSPDLNRLRLSREPAMNRKGD